MFTNDRRMQAIQEVEYLMLKHGTDSLQELEGIIKEDILKREEERNEIKEKIREKILEEYTGRILFKDEQYKLYRIFSQNAIAGSVSIGLKKLKIKHRYEKSVDIESGWQGLTIFKDGEEVE